MKVIRFATLAAFTFVLGCPAEKKTDETPAKTETATPSKKAPATAAKTEAPTYELPKIEGPVAKVNGVDIPADKFLDEYKTTLDRYQRARHPVKPELRERLKDNLVRRLVDAEIIKQQAAKLKVELDDATFAEKWEAHKKRYGSDEAFKSFLERAGTTETGVKEQFRLNLVREKVFATVSDGIKIDNAEVKKFYEDNKQRYAQAEQVRASHILLRVDPKADDAKKAERKKLAEDIAKKAKKKGAKFEDLAKQYGEDPTRTRGGDLGFFTRGRMVKAFETAAWGLKTNQVSGVVETNFGYHIIKKTGHKKAHQKSFNEVKEQIERAVRARKRNTAIREALKNWKDGANIEIFVKGDPAVLNQALKRAPSNLKITPKGGKSLPIQRVPMPTTKDKPVTDDGHGH